jgi:hypothetical protein
MGMSYNWISTLITIYIKDTSNYLVDTTLCDKFVRYLRQVVGFSLGTHVSSSTKTDHHNIT